MNGKVREWLNHNPIKIIGFIFALGGMYMAFKMTVKDVEANKSDMGVVKEWKAGHEKVHEAQVTSFTRIENNIKDLEKKITDENKETRTLIINALNSRR